MGKRTQRIYAKRRVSKGKPPEPKHYILLDIDTLNASLKNIEAKCSKCSRCNLKYEIVSTTGLGCTIKLSCSSCPETVTEFQNSEKTGNLFNVNLQFVYAMRCIGKGQTGADTFCQLMNLSSPPAKFSTYHKKLIGAVKDVANESMDRWLQDAVRIEKSEMDDSVETDHMDVDNQPEGDVTDITDTTAAFDGTWQRKGHSSKNGVVCATSVLNNKVIDVEDFSKFCRCKDKKKHAADCEAFTGNSGAMEVEGVKKIYARSLRRKVRYKNYLGDGDSRGHAAVCAMKPYGDGVEIEKLECVGHVQKRMGTRLRKLKKDEKLLGKKGITDAQINHIQSCYGLAIRQNCKNSVDEMKTAIWALYYHMMDVHTSCPKDSWCKYYKQEGYKKKNPVPKEVMEKTKPIFEDLTQDYLLQRCLHGGTQNTNESFNNVLWSRIPKRVFVQRSTLQLGMFDAVITFNDGLSARAEVLRKLNISPSPLLLAPKTSEEERKKKKSKKRVSTRSEEPGSSTDYLGGGF